MDKEEYKEKIAKIIKSNLLFSSMLPEDILECANEIYEEFIKELEEYKELYSDEGIEE